jgi:hypothetical protein
MEESAAISSLLGVGAHPADIKQVTANAAGVTKRSELGGP